MEAMWEVLKRGLLECKDVASWASGRDAEMEIGVQDIYEDLLVKESRRQTFRRNAIGLISAVGSSGANVAC